MSNSIRSCDFPNIVLQKINQLRSGSEKKMKFVVATEDPQQIQLQLNKKNCTNELAADKQLLVKVPKVGAVHCL